MSIDLRKWSPSLASVAYPAPHAMQMHGKRGREWAGMGMGPEEGRGVAAPSSRVKRIVLEGIGWMERGRMDGSERGGGEG